MTLFRYFADQPDGSVKEWRDRMVPSYVDRQGIQHRTLRSVNAQAVHEPNGRGGLRVVGYSVFDEERGERVLTRRIEFKANPSMHRCSAKCTSAKGFLCECECGGRNHGRGAMVCEA